MNPSKHYPNGVKPNLGDTATSAEIGRGTRAIRVWEACTSCGKERWIKRRDSGTLCKSCALQKHSYGVGNRRWNPTRKTITKSGIRLYIGSDHPYFCMAHKCAKGHAILEHRLVMAESLGRPLEIGEVVHHIDGNNQNNELVNLQLFGNQAEHSSYTMLQTEIYRQRRELDGLRLRVAALEFENVRLELLVSGQGNPDLAGDDTTSPGKSRDFTRSTLNGEKGKEKVHPFRKL